MDFVINMEEAKKIRDGLKEVKQEWLENKPGKGGGSYLGNKTIIQILNHVAIGWDFKIIKSWREEVYRYNKQTKAYDFDGYVYHVQGSMSIPYLGTREQYGSKPAIGGKDNQDSAYKAAASNCMNKCASLFGVGESVYANIKVDMTDDEEYQQIQQNPNYMIQSEQQVQYQAQQYQQPMQQQYQQPAYEQQPQQQYQQQYQQPIQQQQQYMQQDPLPQSIEQAAMQVTTEMQYGVNQQVPFNNAPVGQAEQQYGYQAGQPMQAAQIDTTPVLVDTTPTHVDMTPTPVNAPVQPVQVDMTPTQAPPEQVAQQATAAGNPWSSPEVVQEMTVFNDHKKRLGLVDNNAILPHLRNYFKDAEASMNNVTPENLKPLNDYLATIAV